MKINEKNKRIIINIISSMGFNIFDKVVRNINLDVTKQQKRVLVCYLDYNQTSLALKNGVDHTNQPRFFQILKAFIDNDCVIDVCAHNDELAIKKINFEIYDIIFGFGKVFKAACESKTEACKVIYMTEDPYYVTQSREYERMEYFYRRHKIHVPQHMMRAGKFYLENQEADSDIIICQGQEEHFKNLRKPIYRIVPNAFKNKNYSINSTKRNKLNFVMFGIQGGFIRKGADLLIETFSKHPEWNLYLCDRDIPAMLRELKYKPLPSNIYDMGFVDINSNGLVDLFAKCQFILLPSCSEAPSSAVLTGMRHGLIPIVSRGIGLDIFKEYCYYFDNYKIDDIEKKIIETLDIPDDQLTQRSNEVYKFANSTFTLSVFTKTIKDIISEILEKV